MKTIIINIYGGCVKNPWDYRAFSRLERPVSLRFVGFAVQRPFAATYITRILKWPRKTETMNIFP
jgi:hypothetical protein